ncbi:MAG: glycosyltransferase family 39 protein [Candidatus Omnitrophica bacterium]|nr:glycosyltransferase family 39 protein [Candidatus Omnitrophota bacterium]
MKIRNLLIGLGGALGLWMTFSPGSLFIFFMAAGTGGLLWRCSHPEDRRFLLALFLAGFLIRCMVSLSLDGLAFYVERGRPFQKGQAMESGIEIFDHTRRSIQMGDSDYYSERGYALAQHAKGTLSSLPASYRAEYGRSGYLHIIGAFYYLFDFSPIAVKFINCLLGALLGPILFYLGKECFSREVARWASGTASFFPSLILWSASNLKDTLLILLTGLIFLVFVKIRKASQWTKTLGGSVVFGGLLAIHTTLRSSAYSMLLVGALLLSIFFTSRIRRIVKGEFLFFLTAGLLYYQTHLKRFLASLFLIHVGHITTQGTTYRFLPDELYIREILTAWSRSSGWGLSILSWVGKALFHYLLEPLPGKISGLFLSLAYPQTILWYLLLPFIIWGVLLSLRWNFRRSFFLVGSLGGWILLTALTSGNIGTVFRMRDMVTPFLFLFGWVGIRHFLKGERPDAVGG